MLINSDGQVNNEKSVRHSTQREVIYETLKNTTSHPDVDAIYKEVKRRLPDIGVATVYRNLKMLVAAGKVNTLETTRNCIHYDADVSNHSHFICSECGKITDVFIKSDLTEELEKSGYRVEREKFVFYGICPECIEKKGENV